MVLLVDLNLFVLRCAFLLETIGHPLPTFHFCLYFPREQLFHCSSVSSGLSFDKNFKTCSTNRLETVSEPLNFNLHSCNVGRHAFVLPPFVVLAGLHLSTHVPLCLRASSHWKLIVRTMPLLDGFLHDKLETSYLKAENITRFPLFCSRSCSTTARDPGQGRCSANTPRSLLMSFYTSTQEGPWETAISEVETSANAPLALDPSRKSRERKDTSQESGPTEPIRCGVGSNQATRWKTGARDKRSFQLGFELDNSSDP